MKIVLKYLEGNPIEYMHKRFPVSYTLDVHPYFDPLFTPSDLSPEFGNIEYISAGHDNLPYYNYYQKPDSLLGKTAIVYNDKIGEGTNEAVALDAISHGLRELDHIWNTKYIPELEEAFKKDIEWYSKGSEFPEEAKMEYIDGKIREYLIKDKFRRDLNYLSKEDMLLEFNNYSPELLRALILALNYIRPIKLPEVIVTMRRGGNFSFPTNKLVENLKRISGNKRDMRKKFIKSDRPTYMKNRIVNKALEGLKFNTFDMTKGLGLDLESAFEQSNSEFLDLNDYKPVRELYSNLVSLQQLQTLATVPDFDIEAATTYLTEHAKDKSTGYCARSVRMALEQGGLNTANRPISAAHYNNYLGSLGFDKVLQSGYTGNKLPDDYVPQKGDIVVISATKKHPHGHISMYNGNLWISDFKLNTFHGLKDSYEQYTIWRHK